MSAADQTGDGVDFDYRCLECRLEGLIQRSQIDFEIDFFERILNRDPYYVEILTNLGELFSRKRWHRRALLIDRRLSKLRPENALVMYNLACSLALTHRETEAFATLRRAIELGFDDYRLLVTDPDLASLRQTPEFIAFLQELQPLLSPTR